jgi:hypothetical protein
MHAMSARAFIDLAACAEKSQFHQEKYASAYQGIVILSEVETSLVIFQVMDRLGI